MSGRAIAGSRAWSGRREPAAGAVSDITPAVLPAEKQRQAGDDGDAAAGPGWADGSRTGYGLVLPTAGRARAA